MCVRIDKVREDYKGCGACKYFEDSDPICQLRGCIHAFKELKECYHPKKVTDITNLDLMSIKQFNNFLNDLIAEKEKKIING